MKYSVIASAIIGVAFAVGIPQRRAQDQSCMPLWKSDVPIPDPNTPATFANFKYYIAASTSSATPPGFNVLFTNQNVAVRSHKVMYYVDLDKYEVAQCADFCNASPGCDAFNIFFLRHPSVEPAAACPNPKANTVVRCTLFDQPLEANEALDKGQERGPSDAKGHAFQVRIAGSNAYNRGPSSSQLTSASTTVTVTRTKSLASTIAPSTVTVTQTVTATTSTSSRLAVSTAWPHTSTRTTSTILAKTTQTASTVSSSSKKAISTAWPHTSTVSSDSQQAVSTAWPHTSILAIAAVAHRAASATDKL